MKKMVYFVLLLALTLQVSLAQRSRMVIVEFPNGTTQKGEISRLPNDNRLRLQMPNGKYILFYPNEARRITYEDGSPVVNIPVAQNRQPNQQPKQQTQPSQQNKQGNAQQQPPNQQSRQGNAQQTQPNQQTRQGNAQQTQPNSQNRQAGTQQTQPNQQTRQGNAQQTQPNSQNRQAGTQQTQPNQQTRPGGAQQTKPNSQGKTGNAQQSQQSKPNSKSASGNTEAYEPVDDDFLFDEEDAALIKPPKGKQQKADAKNKKADAGSSKQADAKGKQQEPDRKRQVAEKEPDEEETDFRIRPRGIIEVGYTLGMGSEVAKMDRIEATLSYGIQITPGLFAGLGAGIHLYSDSIYSIYNNDLASSYDRSTFATMVLPIFADLRYNLNAGKFAPFAGVKAGYSLGLATVATQTTNANNETVLRKETGPQTMGMYLAPSAGAKFRIGSSMAVNFSVAYTIQMRKYTILERTVVRSEGMNGITVRAGFEF